MPRSLRSSRSRGRPRIAVQVRGQEGFGPRLKLPSTTNPPDPLPRRIETAPAPSWRRRCPSSRPRHSPQWPPRRGRADKDPGCRARGERRFRYRGRRRPSDEAGRDQVEEPIRVEGARGDELRAGPTATRLPGPRRSLQIRFRGAPRRCRVPGIAHDEVQVRVAVEIPGDDRVGATTRKEGSRPAVSRSRPPHPQKDHDPAVIEIGGGDVNIAVRCRSRRGQAAEGRWRW